MNIFSNIINKLSTIAKNKHGLWIMGFICLFEPVFVPIFPELAIIPLALARPEERHKIYLISLTLSVLGTLLGYIVGYFIAAAFFKILGIEQNTINEFSGYVKDYGFFLPLIGSMLPLPLKLISLTCGMAKFSISITLLSVLVGRGLRFAAGIYLFSKSILGWSSKFSAKNTLKSEHKIEKEPG